MKRRIRRHRHDMPELNMASLPDLIFTVLFFFMIVTHMRDIDLKVSYQVPAGTEVERLTHKRAVIPIYVGHPINSPADSVQIQLGNQVATIADVIAYIGEQRNQLSADDQEQLTVSIHADRNTPMGVIDDIKQKLRQAYALNVSFSATEQAKEQ